MITLRVVAVVLSTSICLLAQDGSRRLEGCPDPAKLAPVLTALQQRKWVGMSAEDLANIWPIRLDDTNSCEPNCQFIQSEDRIIRGRVECGAGFRFETRTNPDGSKTSTLKSITIDYLALTRAERENAKKALVGGFHIGKDVTRSERLRDSRSRFFSDT